HRGRGVLVPLQLEVPLGRGRLGNALEHLERFRLLLPPEGAVRRVGQEAVRPLPAEDLRDDRNAETEVAEARAARRAALEPRALGAVGAAAADPAFGHLEVDAVDVESVE